jgi:hypothetical protein
VPVSASSAGSRAEVRDVAHYLTGTIREEALTVRRGQRFLVAAKPKACANGCQVQALLDKGAGTATSRPGKRLTLRIRLTKAIRKGLNADGRTGADLQLSVTDSQTGAVAKVERHISLRR